MSKLNLNSKLKGRDLINDIIGNTSQYEIKEVPPAKLMPYGNTPGFPFKLHQGKRRKELKQSIIEKGITSPIIVRPIPEVYKEIKPECEYEIIIGHNRNDIALELNLPIVPIIIRKDIDSDVKAIDIMNEDNFLQRQEILPSEKARAYKMQLDAIKKQGKRTDIDLSSSGTEVNSRDEVAKNNDTSAIQIQRYIRLNYLTDKLLEMVDSKVLSFRPAVELSYLSKENQSTIETLIDKQRIKISLKQSEKLREMERELGYLELDEIYSVLSEKKKTRKNIEIPFEKIKTYFNNEASEEEIVNKIITLLKRGEM